MKDLMALGRQNPYDPSESFNMAYLAIHSSAAVNGVSRLHEKVSKTIFKNLFPRWPVAEIPVGHVTNGVHMPSWDSEIADKLWTQAAGKDRWSGNLKAWSRIFLRYLMKNFGRCDLCHERTWLILHASAMKDNYRWLAYQQTNF